MADFKEAYKLTAANEGGYANHPNDRGGETYCGIARKMWRNWEGWENVDKAKKYTTFPAILALDTDLKQKVAAFYKANFWDKLSLDAVRYQDTANELYDTAVNMGVGVAAVFLQRMLNVANKGGAYYADLTVDGRVGTTTIAALNIHPYQEVIKKGLNCLQGAKYIDIAEANKTQEAFVNGWFLNRV